MNSTRHPSPRKLDIYGRGRPLANRFRLLRRGLTEVEVIRVESRQHLSRLGKVYLRPIYHVRNVKTGKLMQVPYAAFVPKDANIHNKVEWQAYQRLQKERLRRSYTSKHEMLLAMQRLSADRNFTQGDLVQVDLLQYQAILDAKDKRTALLTPKQRANLSTSLFLWRNMFSKNPTAVRGVVEVSANEVVCFFEKLTPTGTAIITQEGTTWVKRRLVAVRTVDKDSTNAQVLLLVPRICTTPLMPSELRTLWQRVGCPATQQAPLVGVLYRTSVKNSYRIVADPSDES